MVTKEDTVDTNRKEDKYYKKGNLTKYWEGAATSHEKRNTISHREQYYAENTDVTKTDRRVHGQNYGDGTTRAWV